MSKSLCNNPVRPIAPSHIFTTTAARSHPTSRSTDSLSLSDGPRRLLGRWPNGPLGLIFFVGPCSHHPGRVDLFRHDDGCHRRLLFGAEWLWSPCSDRRVGYMSIPARRRAPKIGPGASVCKAVGKAACTVVCKAACKAMMSRARDEAKGFDGPGAGLALCGRGRLPGLRLLRGPIPMTVSPLIFMGGP